MSVRAAVIMVLLFASVCSLGAPPTSAQVTLVAEGDIVQGETRQFVLRSEKLRRDMRITVAAPSAGGQVFRQAHAADTKLPAIYALDNGWGIAGPVAQMMSNVGAMSPAYVVSIAYAGSDMREADFSFTTIELENRSFGANGANLLAFLTQELPPFLASRYQIDGSQSVLFGHSLGGLFAASVLARQPDAFGGYIIGSAPIHYEPSILAALAVSAKRGAGIRVFIAAGEKEDARVVESAKRMAAALVGPGSTFHVETRLCQ